ncbi:MAG: hypothetical protein RL077_1328, partial [Verrucomicrobiota bacterium]
VGEELLKLMTADVGENTTEFRFLKKPVGAVGFTETVGAEADHLDDLTDGAAGGEIRGVHGGFDVEALRKIDHVFFPGASDRGLGGVELVEGCEGRFVSEVIFTGGHDTQSEGPAVARYGGGGDEFNARIVEQLIEGAGGAGLWVF